MHSLSITFGPTGTTWRLLFKSQDSADAAVNFLSIDTGGVLARVSITDDFGQKACFEGRSIHGWMLENLDESKVAMIELNLHNSRTQASMQQRVDADPTLRAAAASRGPGLISPMGNGRML